MANRIPSRGNFDIPSAIFTNHEWMVDELIDGEIGTNCSLIYPSKRAPCDNCKFDPQTERSSGLYKSGGPIPFPNHTLCPRCQGRGFLSLPETDIVRLRIYWEPSSWRNLGIKVVDADGVCMTIGYMSELAKMEKAEKVILHSDLEKIRRYVCVREGEAQPHGFRRNRYFVQMLRRAQGG